MAGQVSFSHEFYALFVVEVTILVAIPYIDWLLVNNVIYASNTSNLTPILTSYGQAFETIKWSIILPSVAFVWLLRRDLVSVGVWTVSIYLPLATGTEDIVYYLVGQRAFPSAWPWLNGAWGIGWTRVLTGTADVALAGVVVSTIVGWSALLALWYFAKRRGPLGSIGS